MSKTMNKVHKRLMAAMLKQKDDLVALESSKEQDKLGELEMRRGDEVDLAESHSEMEMSLRMRLRSSEEIALINEALDKMNKGVYGVCEKCDDGIGSKRLKAYPYVKYCIDCQEDVESGKGEDSSQGFQQINELD